MWRAALSTLQYFVSKRLNVGSRKQRHVIAHVRTLVFWRQQSFPLKFVLKVTPPIEHNDLAQYPLIVPQPWKLVKEVQLALIASRPLAFQRAIDKPCTLPLSSPKDGTKRDFAVFASKIQLLSKEICYKVSLCENFQWQCCSYIQVRIRLVRARVLCQMRAPYRPITSWLANSFWRFLLHHEVSVMSSNRSKNYYLIINENWHLGGGSFALKC